MVTGRAKDLIIVNGRNVWPQDIEWAIEAQGLIKRGDSAAFSVESEAGERVVVAVLARVSEGERPALALQRYGVEYVEVRLFDLNPLIDIGIAPEQSSFADVFLMMCLLRDSPPITSREQSENDENKRRVVNRGRQPGLHLLVHNAEQGLRPLAHELFDDMLPFAEILDAAYSADNPGTVFSQTLQGLRQRIDNPDLTPSAIVLQGVREHGGLIPYTLHLSRQHQQDLVTQPFDTATEAMFVTSAQNSINQLKQLEALPQGSFEDYVAQYYA